MAVYRFRVTYEDHEEVYRDIEIKAGQNFEDLHNAIQTAFGFDNTKPASFFISDDYWRKGTEIRLKPSEEDDDDDRKKAPAKLMSKSKIAGFIEDPHQKFLYISDYSANWTFWVELTKIILEESKDTYPRCVKTNGVAPKQYKQTNLPPPPSDEDDEPTEKKAEVIFTNEEGMDENASEDDDVLVDGEEEFTGDADDASLEEGAEPTDED